MPQNLRLRRGWMPLLLNHLWYGEKYAKRNLYEVC